ncbi:hypothetical protein HK405_015441, partial [Cladochytrium tenue]
MASNTLMSVLELAAGGNTQPSSSYLSDADEEAARLEYLALASEEELAELSTLKRASILLRPKGRLVDRTVDSDPAILELLSMVSEKQKSMWSNLAEKGDVVGLDEFDIDLIKLVTSIPPTSVVLPSKNLVSITQPLTATSAIDVNQLLPKSESEPAGFDRHKERHPHDSGSMPNSSFDYSLGSQDFAARKPLNEATASVTEDPSKLQRSSASEEQLDSLMGELNVTMGKYIQMQPEIPESLSDPPEIPGEVAQVVSEVPIASRSLQLGDKAGEETLALPAASIGHPPPPNTTSSLVEISSNVKGDAPIIFQ